MKRKMKGKVKGEAGRGKINEKKEAGKKTGRVMERK